MSLNQAVNQHFDNCAKKQEPSAGITPSSSYTFAIYNSASNNWSISSSNPIPLSSKSPSPISSLTDGDSGNGGGGSSSSGTGSGTGAISWGSTKVVCSSGSSSGATTASTCQRSSVITTCSSTASSIASIPATASTTTNVRRAEAAKSSSPPPSSSAAAKSSNRKTIKFADSATTCSDDTTNGLIIISSSSYGETVLGTSNVEMSTHPNNTSSSTINTPTGTKPPSSPVKNVGSGGTSGNKSKSRHSSTSDSTCVTPTGSSSGGAGGGLGGTNSGAVGPPDVHSIRVTRKIFNNWRSACGRTKDKTKDFIRRWKTLPENQSECEAGDSAEQPHHHQQYHTNLAYTPSSGSVHGGGGMSANSMDQSGGVGGASGGAFASINNTSTGGGVASGAEPSTHTTKPSSGFGKIRSLTKKFSQDISEEVSTSSINQSKPSAGWSVHVWATYVQRGLDDDDALSTKEEEKPGRDLLTDFQKTKLTHFFRHVLDMNHDDVISAADFVALNQRIRHYIEWSPECIEFHILKEVHSGFLECFLNQPLDDCSVMYYCDKEKETRDHVNLDEWLDVWGGLLSSARTLEDLPLWLQYFPKIIFQVINKSGSQKISKEELRAFYTMFLGIDFRQVNETLDSIYNAMTDSGRNLITYGLFKLCFTNFLLGRYPHGPGQFLFGICQPQSLHCNFPIDYSALNTPTDDLKPYDPSKDRDHSRRSVIV